MLGRSYSLWFFIQWKRYYQVNRGLRDQTCLLLRERVIVHRPQCLHRLTVGSFYISMHRRLHYGQNLEPTYTRPILVQGCVCVLFCESICICILMYLCRLQRPIISMYFWSWSVQYSVREDKLVTFCPRDLDLENCKFVIGDVRD